MEIAPGQNISIEITAEPTSAAATKTLARLCARDPAVSKARRARKANRPSWETWRRGGKMWHHQMKSALPLAVRPGARYTLRATLDVLRDLQSVERFVRITPK